MYKLTKLFDKIGLAEGEKIERFHFKADGSIFAVETNLSVYQLDKIV